MALTKSIDFGNGVICPKAYLKVIYLNADTVNNTVNFTVRTYFDESFFNKKSEGVCPDKFMSTNDLGATTPTDVTQTPVLNFTNFFKGALNLELGAEAYLLSLDEFKSCTQI